MKKTTTFLFAAALLLLFTGCSSNETPVASIPVIETIAEITEPSENTPFNINDYLGAYEGNGYLEIMEEDGSYCIYYMESDETESSIAEICEVFFLREIVDRKLTIPFTDSWYNIGNIELKFQNKDIVLTITIESYDPSAKFSVSEGTSTYHPTDFGNIDGDPGDPIDPSQVELSQPAGILIGGIYYDDVTGQIPVSLDQIKMDIIEHGINVFSIDRQKVPFDITHLMVIKGDCYKTAYDTYYEIFVHAYYSNGNITHEKQSRIKYEYHDVGGWVYHSNVTEKHIEHNGIVATPFCPVGVKSDQIRYDDYPSGMPISLAEVADDILYADLNFIKVNGVCQYFNIDSIQILKGDFRSSEFGEFLKLTVKTHLSNDIYTGYTQLEIEYKLHDIGGWELTKSYYDAEKGIRAHYPNIDSKIEFQSK